MSTGPATAAEFERSVHIASDTGVPDLTGVLPDLLQRADPVPTSSRAADITSLHAPAFAPDGQVAISLTLNGFRGKNHPSATGLPDRLLAATAAITAKLGGAVPA